MSYGLKDETVEGIKGVFAKYPEVDEAILYGSRAKGNFRLGSDIDLTLKGEWLNLQLLNKISLAIDDLLLPYHVDLSIYHQIDNPDLIAHIERVGKIFYQSGNRSR
ncbi:MAG: nucleotidyltransferase domain-containing protein [Desulfobulbaceae bacterium]|nr:nucleotidyltransferase domain-containing protein [Desulfobulbaceae bacterium]